MSLRRLALLPLLALSLAAADGVDRYRKAYPNTVQLFPDPVPGCGYGVLPKDMPGGADGTREFRWAQPHVVALVRLAAQETRERMGDAPFPLTIMDGAAENGDTPIDWDPAPRARHPGASHDGGLNLDLGYYLTSDKGKVFSPDYAACTEHFDAQPDGTSKDAWICRGPADRLDVPRMACFYVRLFRLNRELFDGDLLSEAGADHFVREAVLAQVRSWIKAGTHGTTKQILDDMTRVLTCDAYEGWASAHHHHTHLQFKDVDLFGKHRAALETLLSRERELDRRLADAAKPLLRARLLSSDLGRTLDAELIPTGLAVKELRFRIGNGPWKAAQPGDPRNRAMLSLPTGPLAAPHTVKVEASYQDAQGPQALTVDVTLPTQDARLGIAVDPLRIHGSLRREGNHLLAKVDFPEPYRALITALAYETVREGGTEVHPTKGLEGETPLPVPSGPARVQARITLSGRKHVRIPLLVQAK